MSLSRQNVVIEQNLLLVIINYMRDNRESGEEPRSPRIKTSKLYGAKVVIMMNAERRTIVCCSASSRKASVVWTR